MKVLTFTGIFKKEGEVYSAVCQEFDVASCGNTIEESKKNLTEAVELYLESAKQLGILKQVFEEAGFEEKEEMNSPTEYIAQITAQLPGV